MIGTPSRLAHCWTRWHRDRKSLRGGATWRLSGRIIGIVDNVLRPRLVGQDDALFGARGLHHGPILAAFFMTA